jgi:hypothetical protein
MNGGLAGATPLGSSAPLVMFFYKRVMPSASILIENKANLNESDAEGITRL